MPKHIVHLKAPNKDINSVSVDGVDYEVKRGFVSVATAHADALIAKPHNFSRVDAVAEEDEDSSSTVEDLTKFSKSELIDFIVDRGDKADRKMSKEQLVELAQSLQDKAPSED